MLVTSRQPDQNGIAENVFASETHHYGAFLRHFVKSFGKCRGQKLLKVIIGVTTCFWVRMFEKTIKCELKNVEKYCKKNSMFLKIRNRIQFVQLPQNQQYCNQFELFVTTKNLLK